MTNAAPKRVAPFKDEKCKCKKAQKDGIVFSNVGGWFLHRRGFGPARIYFVDSAKCLTWHFVSQMTYVWIFSHCSVSWITAAAPVLKEEEEEGLWRLQRRWRGEGERAIMDIEFDAYLFLKI